MTKTPITLDFKMSFFSLYFGQKCVFTGKGRPIRKLGAENTLTNENLYLHCFLPARAIVLKPLSNITNEEAERICTMAGGKINEYGTTEQRAVLGRLIVQSYANNASSVPGWCWLRIFDFLRSRGYAIPFSDYDVIDLVELGWIQLQYDSQ